MASAGLVLATAGSGLFWGAARNQQQKAKSGATTAAGNANTDYIRQKQEARDKNQAPDKEALDKARQRSVMDLQKKSGRASTFLSNGLGG